MRSTRKRSYSEVTDSKRRRELDERRRRSEGYDLPRDSQGHSPKRRRTTDGRERAGWAGGTQEEEDPSPLGYKALEEICHSKCSEDGILELAIKSERFEALLKSSEIRRDLMQLIIRAIHLCCSQNGVRHHAEDILRLVIETKFVAVHVSSFISRMLSYARSSREDFQPSDAILRLADVFLEFLQRFGREIAHSIPVFQLEHTLAELKARGLLHNSATLENRVRQVKELRLKVVDEEFDSVCRKEEETEVEPPRSFRELSIFPQGADLSVTYQPFLRVNVIGRR